MDVFAKNLISHDYDEERLINNFKINRLEETEKTEYDSLICITRANGKEEREMVRFAIRDNQYREDYGFCFLAKQNNNSQAQCQTLYYLETVILDRKLSENFIRRIIKEVLSGLVDRTALSNDRLFTKSTTRSYPFYGTHLDQTIESVIKEILPLYNTERTGIVDLSPECEARLKQTANKYF